MQDLNSRAVARQLRVGPARTEILELRRLFSFANVLVNDPGQDAPPQASSDADVQSETAIVAFGSTVVVAFNDLGSVARTNQLQRIGWARSTDGGATFNDMDLLPTDDDYSDNSHGDVSDPFLARDVNTGRIYLAVLGWRNNFPQTSISGVTLQIFLFRQWWSVFRQSCPRDEWFPQTLR